MDKVVFFIEQPFLDSENMSITETTEAPSDIPVGDTSTEPVEAVDQEPSDDPRFTVKVDGADVEVTLDELRNGYSRQSDYTRKTQELAEVRRRLGAAEALAEALDKDPVNTIKALNDAYQIENGVSQAEWDEMDPQEQRLARLEQQLSQQQAREASSAIEREFRSLDSTYGEIDRTAVTAFAMRHGLTVTDAYKSMNFDTIRQEKERLAGEAKVVDSKRNGVLPTTAAGAQRSAVTADTTGKKMGIRESYMAALKQARAD